MIISWIGDVGSGIFYCDQVQFESITMFSVNFHGLGCDTLHVAVCRGGPDMTLVVVTERGRKRSLPITISWTSMSGGPAPPVQGN